MFDSGDHWRPHFIDFGDDLQVRLLQEPVIDFEFKATKSVDNDIKISLIYLYELNSVYNKLKNIEFHKVRLAAQELHLLWPTIDNYVVLFNKCLKFLVAYANKELRATRKPLLEIEKIIPYEVWLYRNKYEAHFLASEPFKNDNLFDIIFGYRCPVQQTNDYCVNVKFSHSTGMNKDNGNLSYDLTGETVLYQFDLTRLHEHFFNSKLNFKEVLAKVDFQNFITGFGESS